MSSCKALTGLRMHIYVLCLSPSQLLSSAFIAWMKRPLGGGAQCRMASLDGFLSGTPKPQISDSNFLFNGDKSDAAPLPKQEVSSLVRNRLLTPLKGHHWHLHLSTRMAPRPHHEMLSVVAVLVQICFPKCSTKFCISLLSLAATVLFAHNSRAGVIK